MKFTQPRFWKTLERHPISAEYEDITGDAWDDFLEHFRAFDQRRPIILHEDKVLDGWQRQRACVKLGITPVYAQLPKGVDPREFVSQENDRRRHETPSAQAIRREMRRQRE